MPERTFILIRARCQLRKLEGLVRAVEARDRLEPAECSYYDSLISSLELALEPLAESVGSPA